MKQLFIYACMFSLAITSCNNADKKNDSISSKDSTTEAFSDTVIKHSTPAASTPDSATMAKNWQNYMAVTDVQKMMASWNGTWTGDISMWEKPGAAPQKTKAVTVNKMILGGRYQVSTSTATMMGMPFEGQNTLAYDNAKKIFISSWIDNMGTGMLTMKGTWDTATKTINFSGSMVDPSTGNEINERQTFTVIDDKTQLMQMFVTGADGK